jgi:AraC-like DNA-binding protein
VPPAPPQLIRWSTGGVPQAERFDFWRDSISAAFDPMSPELRRDRRTSFQGDIATCQLGEATLMEIRATAHRTGRSPQDIARGSRDYVYLYKQRAEAWFNFDYQMSFMTGPGALVFGDADRPFTTEPSERCGFHHWVLKMPRAAFEPLLARPHDISTRVVSASSGIGALLSSYFDALLAEAQHLTPADQSAALQALTTLTAAAYGRLTPTSDAREIIAERGLKAARQRAVLAEIAWRFHDPGLDVDGVAARLGLSRRVVQRLLEETGKSFTEHLTERRLERARAMLADLECSHLKVIEICLAAGFGDVSHFNRLFRRRFGEAPSDIRAAGGRNGWG